MYKFSVNWMLVVTFLVVIISCEKEEDFNPKFPAKKFVATGTYQGEYWPTNEWRSCSPEEVGMDPKKLKEMNEDIVILLKLHIDVRSVVIIRNGYIVAEQYYSEDYGADSLHRIYSCTKSITSAAMGIAIDEGFIADEYQPLLSFFPEYSVQNPEGKENITLEHMLTMSAGFEWHETTYPFSDERNSYNSWVSSDDRIKFLLDRSMSDFPGSRFNYNTGISHVLSAVIQKQTGIRTDSFAADKIFTPLGISDYYWHIDPNGIANGGNGVRLKPRDLAKFGLLYMSNGQWDQSQIVPEEWVVKSFSQQIVRGDIPGFYYGYQWWVHGDGLLGAVGYGGQLLILIPDLNLIVVFTNYLDETDSFQIQTPWRLLNEYIIPAVIE